MSCEGLDLE